MIVEKNILHKEVKKRLMDFDMTQVQLAKELGIKPTYLNDILQGKRGGNNNEYITKIMKILKMDSCQSKSISD